MKKNQQIILISVLAVTVITLFIPPALSQEQKTYTIYVDPMPYFSQNYASNVMNDAITAWHNANPNVNFVLTNSPQQQYDFEVQWIKDNTGGAFSGEALLASHIMQVTLGDSACGDIWYPYSRATLDSIATHELGHLLGLGHSTDPNNVMNPGRNDFEYAQRENEAGLATLGVDVIPLCNYRDNTSYNYIITDDGLSGLNFYFVPSSEVPKIESDHAYPNFSYYASPGCSGKNAVSLSGTCSGMAANGYLILVPRLHPH